jgi:hypothetical protein
VAACVEESLAPTGAAAVQLVVEPSPSPTPPLSQPLLEPSSTLVPNAGSGWDPFPALATDAEVEGHEGRPALAGVPREINLGEEGAPATPSRRASRRACGGPLAHAQRFALCAVGYTPREVLLISPRREAAAPAANAARASAEHAEPRPWPAAAEALQQLLPPAERRTDPAVATASRTARCRGVRDVRRMLVRAPLPKPLHRR